MRLRRPARGGPFGHGHHGNTHGIMATMVGVTLAHLADRYRQFRITWPWWDRVTTSRSWVPSSTWPGAHRPGLSATPRWPD